MRHYIVWCLSLLLLAGCSSVSDLKSRISEKMFGRDLVNPPTVLQEIEAKADVKLLWQNRVGSAQDYDLIPGVDGDAVYAAAQTGELTKFDAATGKQLWSISASEEISGGTGVGDGLVMVATPKGLVMAFDQTSGKLVWDSTVGGEVLAAPQSHQGIVVVRVGDSRIYGLDAKDGERKWVYQRVTPALSLRSSTGVIIDDAGVAYAGFPGGKLVAINSADGMLIWEATVALPRGTTEIERIADVTSLPVVKGRYVYATAYNGRTVGVERDSGKVLWGRVIDSYVGMTGDSLLLYLTQSSGAIYAMDVSNGETFWRQGGLQWRYPSAPIDVGNYVLVGDYEGYIHGLSREDGSFVSRIKVDSSEVMPHPIALGGSTVLFQTRDGGLYAISIN